MTSQTAEDVTAFSRSNPNPITDIYMILIANICGAFIDAGKPVTKENTKAMLNGFAISVILLYMNDLDLEAETDTFLTDKLVDDVSSLMWEDWLKENIEENEKRALGKNVVSLKAAS